MSEVDPQKLMNDLISKFVGLYEEKIQKGESSPDVAETLHHVLDVLEENVPGVQHDVVLMGVSLGVFVNGFKANV